MRRQLAFLGMTLLTLTVQFSVVAHAADIAVDESEWKFTIAPYIWGAGLSGDVGVFGLNTVEVDLAFSDVLEDLKFAGMGVAKAHNGEWGVFADMIFVSTEANENVGPLKVSLETQSFTGILMGEYRLIETDTVRFDLMAGARVWSVNNDIAIGPLSGSDGDTWLDPMVGVEARFDTEMPLYFTAWGMVGGVVAGSDFSWDVMGGVGYQWTEGFSTVLGYRAVGVDYSNDGFVYDVVQHGVAIGGVFNF